MDASRPRLVLQESKGVKKYHLVNWPVICVPKSCGGLGVLELEAMNQCLLTNWLWKLENTEGLW